MAGMIDSLMAIIEFLILGSMTVAGVLYVAVFFQPLPGRIREYVTWLWETISEQHGSNLPLDANPRPYTFQRALVSVLSLAALYFLGVLTNATTYWALEPVHNRLIEEVRHNALETSPTERSSGRHFVWQSFMAILSRDSGENCAFAAYVDYVKDETKWRKGNREGVQDVLPGLLKFLRIIRGVSVFGMFLVISASFKCVFAVLVVIVLILSEKIRFARGIARWAYRHFISTDLASESTPESPSQLHMARRAVKKMLTPNLVFTFAGMLFFALGVLVYRTVETEYQLMVLYGASWA